MEKQPGEEICRGKSVGIEMFNPSILAVDRTLQVPRVPTFMLVGSVVVNIMCRSALAVLEVWGGLPLQLLVRKGLCKAVQVQFCKRLGNFGLTVDYCT